MKETKMVALKDALSELANVSAELNEESDTINETIAAVEAAIDKSAPGIPTWLNEMICERRIAADGEDPRQHVRYWMIGYDRGPGARFRLVAQQWESPVEVDGSGGWSVDDVQDGPLDEPRLLESCPREVRVEAVALLEALVEQITKAARKSLGKLREARSRLVE